MRVHRELVCASVADERRQIASLLDGLDDEQLATPSLCAGWDVKPVGAHIVSTVMDGTPPFLRVRSVCPSSPTRSWRRWRWNS